MVDQIVRRARKAISAHEESTWYFPGSTLALNAAEADEGVNEIRLSRIGHCVSVTIVERVSAGVVAAIGLYAAVRNRYFAEASVATSRKHFGIHLREGSRAYRFNWIFSRTLTIVIGALMLILGGLGAIGIDWREIYR